MSDERKTPRKWSLEEIDELLQDSGIVPSEEDTPVDTQPVKKAEAVNPRPVRNDDIKHNIISEEIEHSDSVAEPQVYAAFVSNKYRDRFFNKPVQNLEKTVEREFIPPENQKYERSGFIKVKSSFSGTEELEQVPVLVPDDKINEKTIAVADMGKTRLVADRKTDSDKKDDEKKKKTIGLRALANTDSNAHEEDVYDEEDLQLSLEGFHNDEVEHVDEEEVEAELVRKRKEKAESFTITAEINSENEDGDTKKYGTDEYRTEDDKAKVHFYLTKKRNTAYITFIVSAVAFALMSIMSVVGRAFPDTEKIALIISLIMAIIGGVANGEALVDGARAFKGLRLNRNSGAFVAYIAGMVQNIAFLVSSLSPMANGFALLSGAAVLPLVLNKYAEYKEYSRITKNFDYISNNQLYSIGKIENSEIAFQIGRGLLLDEPTVIASHKTEFPRRFLELSRKYYPCDEINGKCVPVGVAISFIIGAITLAVTKDSLNALTAFTASVCVSVPYFSYFADSIVISRLSEKLLKKGSSISGWEAYRQCSQADGITFDAVNLFDGGDANIPGIHRFFDLRHDEILLYTAALIVPAKAPLTKLFRDVVQGDTDLFPPVEDLMYEDKLGLSAWVFNRRILVGSESLLKNHNVDIPDKALIEKHLTEGRYPVYLAIDGKPAAVFIIEYGLNAHTARLIKSIEKNSISLLLRATDANITEDMVARELDIPKCGVKVLSATSDELYKDYNESTSTAADALLMHDGKPDSYLSAINAALSLGSAKNLLNIFQTCAMGIGIAVIGALAFASGITTLNIAHILIMQGFFSVFAIFSMSSRSLVKNKHLLNRRIDKKRNKRFGKK